MKHILRISNRFFSACAGVLLMLCAQSALAGEIELFSADFTSWTTQNVAAGSTVEGIYFKSATPVTNGTGIVFGNNASTSSNYIAIPLSGINGQITITVTHPSARPQWKNYLTKLNAAPTASEISSNPSSINNNTRPGSNTTTSSWTLNCDKSYGVFYIGAGDNNSAKNPKTITITTPCTMPTSVDISGTWLRFAGETLSLTATATGGFGDYSYQWYHGGTDDSNKIAGATSATYNKNNCEFDDAGSYYCKVSTGDGCDKWSGQYEVKMLRMYFRNGRGGGDYGHMDLVSTDPANHIATGMIRLGGEWSYAFCVADGVGHHYGCNNDADHSMWSGNCTDWAMNADGIDCLLWTATGAYATYTFQVDYSNITEPRVTAVFPSKNQAADKVIYFDNYERNWSNLHYRIGDNGGTDKSEMSLVHGTANLWQCTTSARNNIEAWHIGNNCGWSGSNSIFKTKTGDGYAITNSIEYEGGAVTYDAITITPLANHSTGGDAQNNNCEFYQYSMMLGMKTQNVSITPPTNGTITVSYTDVDNHPQSFTSGDRDLAHTCILTITTAPECGYEQATLTVNGMAYTGPTYILTSNATVEATFTDKTYTVTLHTNGGTINSGNVTSYTHGIGATLPTDVTKSSFEFKGWYDNSGLTGSPVTEISATECENKEYWAKWNLLPEFTWTYDATVKAGGIYPMSVSSTGDADVTLTLVSAVTGVTPTFTAGNPATGTVALNAYPSATTFTYQATSPATATYGELTETRTVTIERCETEYTVAFGVGYEDGGSSAHPRYYHETAGVGRLTKGNGSSGCAGDDASWTGESWITKSNKSNSHLLQTYQDNVVKLVFYVMAGGNDVTISKLRISDSYISSDTQGSDGLAGATIIYNNDPAKTGLDKNVQQVATVLLASPLDENDFVYVVFSTSSTLYGVKLYRAEGDEVTSVAFSGETLVEKFEGDAPFTQVATQTTTPIKSGGSITYSSSDEVVATVNKNTGEVTPLQVGNTRIIATLNAYGCFMKATAEYTLRVKACTDPECTIVVTTGSAKKCAGASVTMTATAAAGATFQWYKDGVAIPGETSASLTTDEPGDYYVEARKTCLQTSNTITVSNLGAPTATRLHEYYYVKAGRVTPDIELFQLTNATGFTMSPTAAPDGCTYELREDGIVYLTGTPATTLATEDYDITVTATNDCGSTTATATMHLYSLESTMHAKIAWIADGTKGETLPGTVDAAKSTSHVLYQYLQNYFDLTPVNAYCTIDTNAIKDYYSQFDLVLLTDYPDTNTKPDGESGGKEKSYSNAIGCLIDEKPILSFEAFVADCPNWGINQNPETPSPKQTEITLLCAAHEIFDGTVPIDEKIKILSEMGGDGLQGFAAGNAPSGMIYIATIEDPNNSRTLINCCERQQVIEARMMIMGLNYGAMAKVNNDGKKIIKQIIDYLLNPNTMADCALIFDDAHDTHIWSDPQNWAPSHNAVPKAFQAVRIDKDCNVDVTNAHCSSVRLLKGTKGLETYDAHLTILPGGGLTVTDFIKEVHGANFMTTYPISSEDLIIQASPSGQNGTLVFGNESEGLAATVEYQSIASGAPNTPSWQYMGIPIIDRPMAIDQYYAAWMCSWESVGNVSSNWRWVENEDRIVPFTGYCITQAAPHKYTHVGTLNAPETKELTLRYFTSIDGNGFNMFANSWVAPIDITKMRVADFGGAAEATIFIYNTGTRAEYEAGGSPSTDGTNTGVGQFNAIPVAAASYLSGSLTKIPTMQGFFVQATKTGTLTLDYDRVCFNTTDYTTTSETMRAPRRMSAEAVSEEQIVPEVMRIDVTAEHFGDRVYILAHPEFSDAFDRGWDGSKQEGDADAPMLAFVEGNRLLAVAAVQTADERYLSFRAGQDEDYTFTFEYEGETLYLYDRLTQQATEIRTGNTYSFSADNQAAACRFLITANPPHETTTAIEELGVDRVAETAEKIIHEGRLLILYGDAVYDALGERVERKEGAK